MSRQTSLTIIFLILLAISNISFSSCFRISKTKSKTEKFKASVENQINTYIMLVQQQFVGTNVQKLLPNTMGLSPSGLYKLTMQTDGNLVLSSVAFLNGLTTDQVLWATGTNTPNPQGNYLTMQDDGNLVIYNSSNTPVWNTGTFGKGQKPYQFLLQDNGNLVIYDSNGSKLWASGTYTIGLDTSPIPNLQDNKSVTSPNGLYKLSMQTDGNLVLYTVANTNGRTSDFPIWDTRTFGQPGNRLAVQDDGNFVLYNNKNSPVWASNNYNRGLKPYRTVLQDDGNIVTYDASATPLWASNSFQNVGMPVVNLATNQTVSSRNANFKLTMGANGALTLYKVTDTNNPVSLWSSTVKTPSSGKSSSQQSFQAVMQTDGNFVVYDNNNFAVWASNSNGKGNGPYNLLLQNDGNLVIYDSKWTAQWASNTNQQVSAPSSSSNNSLPACANKNTFGYQGNCSSGNIVDKLNSGISSLGGNAAKVMSSVVSPLSYIFSGLNLCIGDFTADNFNNDNNLQNAGCGFSNLDTSFTYSSIGFTVNNVICGSNPNPQNLSACFIFDNCGTVFTSINGGSIGCIGNLGSGGFANLLSNIADFADHLAIGFSPQRRFTNSFNLGIRSNDGVNIQSVTTRGHFEIDAGLQLPIDYKIGNIKLGDLFNFTIRGIFMIDFGMADNAVSNMINLLLNADKTNAKNLVQQVINQGPEISATITGTFTMQLQALTRGFLDDVNFNVANANVLLTSGKDTSSGLPGGIYILLDGQSLQNAADIISKLTGKFSKVLKALGFSVPSNPQLGQGAFVALSVDTQFFSFNIKLNSFNLACMYQFSNSNGSCNTGDKFFSAISKEVGMVIQEAKQFFDNTGKELDQFAQTSKNDLSNAAAKVENQAKMVAQATQQEAQKVAAQLQNMVQQATQKISQEWQNMQQRVTQSISPLVNDVKNFFNR